MHVLPPASDWLAARAAATPHRPAVFQGREVWTFAQWDREVHRAAVWLQAQGVRAGHRVAAWRLPRREALVLLWAVARLGAVWVPLHHRWTPSEVARAAQEVRPHWVVVGKDAPTPPDEAGAALPWGGEPLSREAAPAHDFPGASWASLQGLVFTSGSTGRPKAAALTWANHFWSAWASAARLGLHRDDAWLLQLPLYHVGGLATVFRCVLYGIPLVLPPREGPFDPDLFRTLPFARPPTLISLVPTMLYRLLDAGVDPWPGLRVVLVGGAAALPSLLEEARARGWPLALTYGMTETASQVATAEPELAARKPGTVGTPLLFTRVVIRDDAGQALSPGEEGEITVRGPTVFAGYWGNAEATARALRRGWLYTGDLGYLDEEGHLWVRGRRAFTINTGGEKVHPQEVEAVLSQHPAVAEVCVVGVPDPEWGQRVAAAVVLRPESRISPEELARFCRQRLAGYKVPRVWAFWPRLPRTPTGKIDRVRVQEMLQREGR